MINLILAEEVPYFQFITAQFAGSQQPYTYKTDISILKAGDLIVVEAPSGLTVVTVTEVGVEVKPSPKYAIKWVVDKVEVANYKRVVKIEKALFKQMAAKQAEDKTLLASGKNKTVSRL